MAGKAKKAGAKKKRREREVGFAFYAPYAQKVYLAGDFNSWDERSLPMGKDRYGFFRIKLKLLPGRHEFKFIADGVWVEDLSGAEPVQNRLGTRNYVIAVE